MGYFCPFTLLNSPKNEKFLKMKKLPGDIIMLLKCTKIHDHICTVQINVPLFGKFNAFFIFHNRVFPNYQENYTTKEGSCFLNRGTKTKFFLAVNVKNNLNRCVSHFYYNIYAAAVLTYIRFFSLILIGVSFSVICSFYFCAVICWLLFYDYLTLF